MSEQEPEVLLCPFKPPIPGLRDGDMALVPLHEGRECDREKCALWYSSKEGNMCAFLFGAWQVQRIEQFMRKQSG